ncbi:hypothetical protein K3G39_05965 [Pontibacter sp. HSC-14F20]|uniref:hypothetical protein n=1 Tax=Pontibacter sp. HSC-14F20 TaxID=2864136 RepID=UPI001C72DBB9|nr:hypothetical protein [Pontibacter sp. HSC-14F20]MBX0332777.1 hypothetical protein [Pontibacter sp. HSC-14F20]
MEFLLGDILLAGVGWLYLLIRYRKKEAIAKVLAEEYEGSYSKAGSSLTLNIFDMVLATLLFVFLITFIFI